MGKFYKIGFFVLLFLIIIGAAFYLGLNWKKAKEDSQKISPTPTFAEEDVVITEEPEGEAKDEETVKDTIRAAIDTKNTQALEGYMTDSVNVTIESSECCGPRTKSQAINDLNYLEKAQSPWNFDQNNETIKKLKSTDPKDYGPESTYVGIASNEYVVAFKFNDLNQIEGITVAATYKLVVQ